MKKTLRKLLKWTGIALVAVLVISAILYPMRRDPILNIPGKRLSGEEVAYPSDWEFTRDHQLSMVETNPDAPYSVTTVNVIFDGKLHIPSVNGASKKWPQNVLEDSRVRIKIDGSIYPARLTRVDDEMVPAIFSEMKAKYPPMAEEEDSLIPTLWLFEVSPR